MLVGALCAFSLDKGVTAQWICFISELIWTFSEIIIKKNIKVFADYFLQLN